MRRTDHFPQVLYLLPAAHSAAPGTPGAVEKAAHATALSGELVEWVQLIPAGTFSGIDGRGPYHLADPEAVIQLTRDRAGGNDLPIDYGHALEAEGVVGDGAPAAGWITDLEVRDGSIWGQVAWTEAGAAKVRGREYRFLSPVFYHDRSGTVRVLVRAGLTNRPNLQLKSINSTALQGKERGVEELRKRIALALGLEASADEAAVLARCSAAVSAEVGMSKVAQSLSLEGSPSTDELISAVEGLLTVDPAKYVPREQFDRVAHALAEAQQREGVQLVDAAISEGKITPAQRAWALSYHSQNPKGFAEFIAAQPQIIDPNSSATGEPPAGQVKLDEGALAVCAALGIAHDEFTANLES